MLRQVVQSMLTNLKPIRPCAHGLESEQCSTSVGSSISTAAPSCQSKTKYRKSSSGSARDILCRRHRPSLCRASNGGHSRFKTDTSGSRD